MCCDKLMAMFIYDTSMELIMIIVWFGLTDTDLCYPDSWRYSLLLLKETVGIGYRHMNTEMSVGGYRHTRKRLMPFTTIFPLPFLGVRSKIAAKDISLFLVCL